MEHRDPVLRQELVEQAAAEITYHATHVHDRRHGRRQHRVNGEQQRRDEQEGELQRLGDPDQHRGQGGGDQQTGDLDAVLRRGGEIERQRNPHRPKHFRVTVQGKATLREQRLQRFRTLTKRLQVLSPVDLQTALHDRRAKDERAIDEMVQAGGDQDALKENVDPHPKRPGRAQEGLQRFNTQLDFWPAEQRQPGAGDHREEGDNDHKR